jgi:hypothetical protein
LWIEAKYGSPSNLVLKAHQQGGLKIFTRSSSGFVVRVHSSTIPVAPKVLKSQGLAQSDHEFGAYKRIHLASLERVFEPLSQLKSAGIK